MAIPTFVANSLLGENSVGAVTPALPLTIATNDILLLIAESAGEAVTIPTPNGGTWTEVANSPQTPTGAGTRLTAFWSRYNGTQGNPTTNDPGDHISCIISAYRGCETSGNPWDVSSGGVNDTIDNDLTATGATTTVADCLVVIMAALGADVSAAQFSAWANADLASVTERVDFFGTAGNGGGVGAATGEKASAGAYGNTTATNATSGRKGWITLALKPPQAVTVVSEADWLPPSYPSDPTVSVW